MENIDRRKFLEKSAKTAATVAAGAGLFNINRLGRTASDEILMGVMGIHGRGRSHINAWCSIPGVRVVALCDPDTTLFPSRSAMVEKKQGHKPKTYADIREMLKDKNIDAISIATCNHWHALGTIWACQAGKDVYVEKPACHEIYEGQKMIEAARKYKRIVQVGSQGRSNGHVRKAIELIRNGAIGEVYMARGLCYKPRWSIGFKPDEKPPSDLKYDLWLGPAPYHPYNKNFVHYNWHWFWDFGNGDIGNQGVHQMDIARWGLGKELPVKVSSMGGRCYKDQGQTPNTQTASFWYDDGKLLVFEVRGLHTNDEAGVKIGNLFYGSEGWIAVYGTGGPYDLFRKGKKQPREKVKGEDHFANFIKAVRSRNPKDLSAEVREGVLSADLCHLANISYRVKRALDFDPKTQTFPGDEEANKLLTHKYRPPFVIPDPV